MKNTNNMMKPNNKKMMKKRHSKLLSFLVALFIVGLAVLIVGIATMPNVKTNAASNTSSNIRGDVDMNGKITSADARLALRAAVGLEDYAPGSDKFIRADYDSSGKITSGDARMILRTAVELEPIKYLDEEVSESPDEPIMLDDNYRPIDENYDPYYYLAGAKSYDPNRIGMYYLNGVRVKYEDIPEGAHYVYYDEYGWQEAANKPYSPGNEPVTEPIDLDHCQYCGKDIIADREHFGCYYGGCTRWIIDINCPECGKFVPANTCHTCGN